jgi:hypothetical protein
VKISANYLSVSMYLISISPFSIWSLKKWCITHEENTLVDLSIISHIMYYLKNFGATASSCYILGLCGGLWNGDLFVRRPTNKRRTNKMTCSRSAFSINSTLSKINIGKSKNIK